MLLPLLLPAVAIAAWARAALYFEQQIQSSIVPLRSHAPLCAQLPEYRNIKKVMVGAYWAVSFCLSSKLSASATYLTHGGAPLAIFDTTSDGQGPVRRAWLVSPQRGRHVAFLGDRLHGVPAELAPENLLESRIHCAKDDPGTTRISVLVNLWDRKPVGVSRAAPYRGSTLPIDVSFAQPVAPPIVVQPKDHHIRRLGDANTHLIPGTENYAYLAEHRDGDTLPIPITRWIHSLAGGIPGWALELRSGD